MQKSGIPGIYGIDTRRLTKLIRRQGVMNGKITQDISDLPGILEELRGYTIQNAVESVTCQSPQMCIRDRYETIRAKRMISFLLCVSLLSLTAAFFFRFRWEQAQRREVQLRQQAYSQLVSSVSSLETALQKARCSGTARCV